MQTFVYRFYESLFGDKLDVSIVIIWTVFRKKQTGSELFVVNTTRYFGKRS